MAPVCVDTGHHRYCRGLSHYSDPLIEVYSVTISPSASESSFLIYGQIYVEGGEKILVYDRPEDDPETITSTSDHPSTSLSLTGPVGGVIKMDGQLTMSIHLKVRGPTPLTRGAGAGAAAAARKLIKAPTDVWFAKGCLCLDEPDEPAYHENKSLTLKGNLGDVEVSYIYMPFARVARVTVTFNQQGQEDSHTHTHTHTRRTSSRSRSPHAHGYISGKITARYGNNNGTHVILFHNKQHAPVHYGVPINLCRSLVCIPSYYPLSIKLDNMYFEGKHKKRQFQFSQDFDFEISSSTSQYNQHSINNVHVTVELKWFTTAALEGASSRSVLAGCDRIQVLSVFAGHEGNKQVDIWGSVAVRYWRGSVDIFKEDMGSPRKSVSRKGSTLVGVNSYPGVTSYPGDTTYPDNAFSMFLYLQGPVDINNYFRVTEYVYSRPGKWFNIPLCHLLLGKQGFAAVHFMVLDNAEKVAVKISVISKYSNASCPYVFGTLVAQYGNYNYSTNYQKKYWSIDLFQEKEEDARKLSEDGEISLLRDEVSVPGDSYLVLVADLYVSSWSAGTCCLDGPDDHFVKKVEIRIGDVESRIQGRTYDLVVGTKWEPHSERVS